MRILISVAMLAACGGVNSGGNDAHGGGGGAIDAAPSTVMDVTCGSSTTTIVDSNGAMTVTDAAIAFVTGIDKDSWFSVEQCDHVNISFGSDGSEIDAPDVVQGACPTGSTCTTTGVHVPSYQHACTVLTDNAFLDGALEISCRSVYKEYDATGKLTFGLGNAYGTTRIHH